MLQKSKKSFKNIIKNIIKKNSGKIVIATLFFAVIIGIGFTTVNSHANTKEVVVPTTVTNVRETYEIVNGSPVGRVIASFGPDTQLDYLDTVTDTRGINWYKVGFKYQEIPTMGYISATYSNKITITEIVPVPVPFPGNAVYPTDAEFENAMAAQGFPESYKVKLRALRLEYPYMSFEAFHPGLTWAEALYGQTRSGNISLVEKTARSSWKSLINDAYDWRSGEWKNFEPGWTSASPALVAYYLDPRNFLNTEGSVLQFYKLNHSSEESVEGLKLIMGATYSNTPQGQSIIPTFLEAAVNNNVSAYHLASRAMQETGYGTTNSALGTYPGFENLYNFFNISSYMGAFPDHPELRTPVENGLYRARLNGWTTPSLSITGGAPNIAERFVHIGQNTLYLQKFDIIAQGGLYNHQYMTNIRAPWAEGTRLLKGYPDIKTKYVTLSIPVYKDMPESNPIPTDSRNPNNILSSLSVNGVGLTPAFDVLTHNYSVVVSDATTSVIVSATPASTDATIGGMGEIPLNATGVTVINVVVQPPYGDARTYTINVVKSSGVPNLPVIVMGDFNGNGKIDLTDLVKFKLHYVGKSVLQGAQLEMADMNKDGKVSLVDIVKAKRIYVGLE